MAIITRANADALIPLEQSNEIIKEIPNSSKLLPMMRRLPNMSASQRTLPVMSALPNAYFVNGEGGGTTPANGMKQTSNAEWDKLTLTAEEIAVIVPIPEAVLDDANYDIWGEIRPYIVEAFGTVIDAAVLFGTNKPSTWASAIVPTAIAAGNVIEEGTNVDLASDIIGVGGLMQKVEADGYRVNGFLTDSTFEANLRDLRNANRDLLYLPSLTSNVPSTLVGRPIMFDYSGAFDLSQALMVAGDWTKAVYAIRQDITYKVLDQAVIQKADGSILYNLAQQDMVALRCVMRLGVQIANPVNRRGVPEAERYPFAVLTPAETTP